jgi:hypothetical protein
MRTSDLWEYSQSGKADWSLNLDAHLSVERGVNAFHGQCFYATHS